MAKPLLALSTSWNSFRHTDGHAMLREIAALGFTHAELSHGIRIILVPGILRALEEGVIKISSTHNFCPLPTGINHSAPNLFEPSALDRREHEQWLRHTKRSLDFAAQIKARVMVLHLGSVKFWWSTPGSKLDKFIRKNPQVPVPDDPGYRILLRRAGEKMRDKMLPAWKQMLDSLEEIRLFANERKIALGLENREKFEELPMDDDFNELFGALRQPSTAGYWHDTGHAALKQTLGTLEHRLHLEKLAPRLLGFHLHDVSADGKDHQAVGSGRIDFKMISTFWKPEHLLTLELSPRLKLPEVMKSKERIEALMAERFGS